MGALFQSADHGSEWLNTVRLLFPLLDIRIENDTANVRENSSLSLISKEVKSEVSLAFHSVFGPLSEVQTQGNLVCRLADARVESSDEKGTIWGREIRSWSRPRCPSLHTGASPLKLKAHFKHRLVQRDTHIHPLYQRHLHTHLNKLSLPIRNPQPEDFEAFSIAWTCLPPSWLHEHPDAQATQPYHSDSAFLEAKTHTSLFTGRYEMIANEVVIRGLVCV